MSVLTWSSPLLRIPRPDPLIAIAVLLAVAVLLPIAVLGLSWLGDESEVWRHLADTVLLSLLGNTLLLVTAI